MSYLHCWPTQSEHTPQLPDTCRSSWSQSLKRRVISSCSTCTVCAQYGLVEESLTSVFSVLWGEEAWCRVDSPEKWTVGQPMRSGPLYGGAPEEEAQHVTIGRNSCAISILNFKCCVNHVFNILSSNLIWLIFEFTVFARLDTSPF